MSDVGGTIRYRGPLTISVAVAASLYLVAIWLSDGRAVLERLSRLPPWMIGVALILPTVGFFSRFWRWDIFLRSLGHRLPFLHHFRIYMSGFALTTTPGKVGENVRAMYLTSFGVPVSDSVAAFVVERLGDVFAMLLLASLIVRLLDGYEWVMGLTAAVSVLLLWALRNPALPPLLLARDSGDGVLRRIMSGLGRSLESAADLLSPRLLVIGVVMAIAAWSAEAVTFALLARHMGVEVPFLVGMGIFAVATLLGAISFLPGGVGPTEAVMVGLLVVSGGTVPAATAATVLIRVFTLWWAVALGVIALLGLRNSGRRPSS